MGAHSLTGREPETARLSVQRLSREAIGQRLDLSTRSVSTYVSNVFGTLGEVSRGELARLMRQLRGWLGPEAW